MPKTNTPSAPAEEIVIQPVIKTNISMTIVGDSELILHKRPRSVDAEMLFKQSHPKGTKIPDSVLQPYNMWEKLITSIHWRDPIPEPDNWAEYDETMWNELMQNNAPQIVGKAFKDTWAEAFISFMRASTGIKGTDFRRSVVLHGTKLPITFAGVSYSQHLTPNTGLNPVPVINQYNVFEGWKCDISLSHVDTVIPTATILNIIQAAGEFIGVGSRRAEGFGRYHIENVSAAKDIREPIATSVA